MKVDFVELNAGREPKSEKRALAVQHSAASSADAARYLHSWLPMVVPSGKDGLAKCRGTRFTNLSRHGFELFMCRFLNGEGKSELSFLIHSSVVYEPSAALAKLC